MTITATSISIILAWLLAETREENIRQSRGKQDAHHGGESSSTDMCPKSSRDARSAGLRNETAGPCYATRASLLNAVKIGQAESGARPELGNEPEAITKG